MRTPLISIRAAVCVAFIAGAVRAGTIVYVDADATGPIHDGASWCTAYVDLQQALNVAVASTTIRVANGTYRPSKRTDPADPRSATFQLTNGVAIEGGYAGCGASNPDHRDFAAHQSILSGDIKGNDTEVSCDKDSPECDQLGGRCILSACLLPRNLEENTYHVVTGSGTDQSAVLDGFIVTAGFASGNPATEEAMGGGLYIAVFPAGSPIVRNCEFSRNVARHLGGAIMIRAGALTVLSAQFRRNYISGAFGHGGAVYAYGTFAVADSLFTENFAPDAPGISFSANISGGEVVGCRFIRNIGMLPGSNGGALNLQNASVELRNCVFWENVAGFGGAIMSFGNQAIVNCSFYGNSAFFRGGAISAELGSPTLVNCLFSGNKCTGSDQSNGGAVYVGPDDPIFAGCTFVHNTADIKGGGLHNWTGNPTLQNCVFWDNSDSDGTDESSQIYSGGGTINLTHSTVQGLTGIWGGAGNIASNPVLVDVDGADDTLGTPDDDLHLAVGSPCIDAGSNAAVPPDTLDLDGDGGVIEPTPHDLDGSPRFVDDSASDDCPQLLADCGTPPIVDMGAYEFQGDCELQPAGTPCGDPSDTECDNPDTCDGKGHCLANLEPRKTLCRPSAGPCDLDETCNGDGECRPDRFADVGTPCGNPADTDCDNPDVCDGAGTCLANPENSDTPCREAVSECDVTEFCDGNDPECPPDRFRPPGTPCGGPADSACDHPDTCDELGVCQYRFEPDGLPCSDGRFCTSADECLDGQCEGQSETCVDRKHCDEEGQRCICLSDSECDDGDACTLDECLNNGECVHERDPYCALVRIDIQPGCCPNPVYQGGAEIIRVVIVGNPDIDVELVDLSSLELVRADGHGRAVKHLRRPVPMLVDVATPFDDLDPSTCAEKNDCTRAEGDGETDLSLKFAEAIVVQDLELGSEAHHAKVRLLLRGRFMDGTPFEAGDCIQVRRGRNPRCPCDK